MKNNQISTLNICKASTFMLFVLLSISTLSNAEICTDDYLISCSMTITLLPDSPFEILKEDKVLFVKRGTFIFEFTNPKIIHEKGKMITRYSSEVIGDEYFFDLISTNESEEINWEHYARTGAKRGFGGTCTIK